MSNTNVSSSEINTFKDFLTQRIAISAIFTKSPAIIPLTSTAR